MDAKKQKAFEQLLKLRDFMPEVPDFEKLDIINAINREIHSEMPEADKQIIKRGFKFSSKLKAQLNISLAQRENQSEDLL